MRVGFITSLLWDRYGAFWRDMVADAGADVVLADSAATRASLEDGRLAAIPGLAFRIAAAEALNLATCDLIVAPDLNHHAQSGRGGGQDPWIASFPDALASSVGGIPRVLGVPASLEGDVEPIAVALLQQILGDATRLRRVWDRFRARAQPPRPPSVRWQLRPSETRTVGVVGQPWLVNDEVLAELAAEGEHLVGQHALDAAALRGEGSRLDPKLLPTDAEVVGAARLFARRGSVEAVRAVLDLEAGSDAWLARRIEEVVRKPVSVTSIRSLADPVAALLPRG